MNKKYELTDETKQIENTTLYRIKALRDFSHIDAGDLGGFVESEKNLSHYGDCWIYQDACSYSDAAVTDSARVSGHAIVKDSAVISKSAHVRDFAIVSGLAHVSGKAQVYSHAVVHGSAYIYGDAIVYANANIGGQAYVYGDAIVSGDSQLAGNVAVHGTAHIVSTSGPLTNGVFDAGVISQQNQEKTELNKMKLEWEDDGFQLVSDTPALGCDHVEMSFPMQLKEKGMAHWYCCKKCGEAIREFSADK